MDSVELKPIGVFHSSKKHKQDASRQAVFDEGASPAWIELFPKQNFEQALQGLEKMSHVWVIFLFHENSNWNPMVTPPRGPKTGVFSTRSPHRPNPIGMSALQVLSVQGLRIEVGAHDILDGSPILDIKPYHVEADSFPEARMGWIQEQSQDTHHVSFSQISQKQIDWLKNQGLSEMQNFIQTQLSAEPLNHKKKRVLVLSEESGVLAYKTWRIHFSIQDRKISVNEVRSGYSVEDLESVDDPYTDKELHRIFLSLKN